MHYFLSFWSNRKNRNFLIVASFALSICASTFVLTEKNFPITKSNVCQWNFQLSLSKHSGFFFWSDPKLTGIDLEIQTKFIFFFQKRFYHSKTVYCFYYQNVICVPHVRLDYLDNYLDKPIYTADTRNDELNRTYLDFLYVCQL